MIGKFLVSLVVKSIPVYTLDDSDNRPGTVDRNTNIS